MMPKEPRVNSVAGNFDSLNVAGSPVVTESTVAVLSRTVTLTNAQIKALPTTWPELVPALGAGKAISFISAIAWLDAMAGAYTNVDASATLQVCIASVGSTVPDSVPDLLGDDSDVYAMDFVPTLFVSGGLVTSNSYYSRSTVDNVPVQLVGSNASNGDFTGGNPANTLKVTVLYSVIDL
jgi:hypothetical protein